MIAACAKVALTLVVALHAYVVAPIADTLDGDVAPVIVVDPCIARDVGDCDVTLDESPRAAVAPTSDDGDTDPPADDPWESTRADDAEVAS